MKKTVAVFAFLLGLFFVYRSGRAGNLYPDQPPKTKTTIVYLVRHAEKSTTNPDDNDPDLTPAGYARAKALQKHLQNIPIDVFLSSPYKRTRLTLTPLAAGREIGTYPAHGYTALKKLITGKYAGETIIVAGHSNTLLDIIETFGAAKPVRAISDSKYDYIFKLTLRPGKKAKVETATFGQPTT
ncbi:histidine phosphatase family protein [Adhaeribacter swui]|uniref:Histidine phosphatase family protein n=1 Tax=Adhaeribacter swui TaxID=2086471 RepID=A0A7G7G355_9BACT|nr:phosphoglycerate mutase family protein [Adhaeribacter swui]QNF31589.1 histidine phosphatase family protein [Adhaeribacter swui]